MKNKILANRSFGILFCIVFLLIAIWPILDERNIRIWSIIISIIFLILGLLNSKFLSPFNKAWLKLGEILGRIISPIVLAIIYYVIITPIGIIVKMFGKDLLNLKLRSMKTYWIKRDKNIGPMNRQF